MNHLLPILGPLMPTLQPNNREKFWSKSQTKRELDRIGWTGKYIVSDSSEEEESCEDEISEKAGSSNTLFKDRRDDYYHNTSWDDYWRDVYFAGDSDIASYHRECEDIGADSHYPSSSKTSNNTATSSTHTEDERDDYYYKTSQEEYWNNVCFSDNSDVSDSEREVADSNDGLENDWSDGEEFAEEIVVNWVVGILFLVLMLGGAWCIVSRIR